MEVRYTDFFNPVFTIKQCEIMFVVSIMQVWIRYDSFAHGPL